MASDNDMVMEIPEKHLTKMQRKNFKKKKLCFKGEKEREWCNKSDG